MTHTGEVVALIIRPNQQSVWVEFPRGLTVKLDETTAVFQAGAVMRLADVPEWFMGSEDTVYTTVVCEVEAGTVRATAARFERK